jgi:putative membrane protein
MTMGCLLGGLFNLAQQEKTTGNTSEGQGDLPKQIGTSKKVSDHLANERTFLAWIRTGLATITFGFVVERFGLVLQELGLKSNTSIIPVHLSSFFGISLTVLGVIVMIVALVNFLQIRRAIDAEQFHPPAVFAIVLTVLASLIGILLAIYLFLTA